MRVLFLTNNLGNGGAERVLINLVNRMDKNKFDITVRTLIEGGCNLKDLSPEVNYEYIFRKSFRGINYLHLLPHKFIYNLTAGGNFDVIVVYLHGVLTQIVSYAPCYQKTVAYLHANMEKSPFMQRLVKKQKVESVFSSYNQIVAVSQDVKESFWRTSGLPPNKVCVKYNTFAVDKIRQLALQKNDIENLSTGMLRMCAVGKVEHGKGSLRLVKVIHRLIEAGYSQLHLDFIGDGAEVAYIKKYLAIHKLESFITLKGFTPNPYPYIAHRDLLVCPSYSEGFSSVVAESIILGTPVLTTDCAGMKEILGDNNQFGIIVANNSDALYEGLKGIVDNPQTLAHYRMQAKKRADFFSTERTVKAVEDMLESLVK